MDNFFKFTNYYGLFYKQFYEIYELLWIIF